MSPATIATPEIRESAGPTRVVPEGSVAGAAILAGLALIVGAVVVQLPLWMLIVAVPLGIGLLGWSLRRPLVALVVMVVVEVVNLGGVLAAHSNVPVFQGTLVLGAVALWAALRDPAARGRLNRWTVICAGLVSCYFGTQAIAMLSSTDVAQSMSSLRRAALDCVFLLVLLMLAQVTARPWVVAAAIVAPLAALSLLSLVNEGVFAGGASFGGFSVVTTASGELTTTLRYGGPLPDSNFWGRHLVMALPLACALSARALGRARRSEIALWVGSMLALLIGIYLTQSRGTFVATAVAVVVWVVASGPRVRRWGLIAAPFAVALMFVPGIGNRLVALVSDVFSDGVDYGVDPSVLGRSAAQQIAWSMFGDRPWFGFGPGTYLAHVPDYAGSVATAVLEPTDAPHNLYAQLAAESGVVGLLGWAVCVLGFVALLMRRIVADPHDRDRMLTAAVCAGIVAWSIASIFLHLAYFRTFGVVLALAGALIASTGPVDDAARTRLRAGVTTTALSVLLGAGAAGAVLWATGSPATTATVRVSLAPPAAADGYYDGYYAYGLDVRSRVELLPTFAALMAERDSPATFVADPVRGVITVKVTDPDGALARARVDAAVTQASARLGEFGVDTQYEVVPLGPAIVEQSTQYPELVPPLAIGLGLGVAAATATVRTRRNRRPEVRA